MTYKEALAAGATFGGPVFKRNMVRALQLHAWDNTPAE